MKNVWIKAAEGDWNTKRNQITAAMESGADFVFADAADLPEIKQLGKIKTACFFSGEKTPEDADVWVWNIPILAESDDEKAETAELKQMKEMKAAGKTVAAYVDIQNKKTELFAAAVGKTADYLIISAGDWRIIPLENLIAALEKYDVEIITDVRTDEEAQTALQILEKGVDGVLIESNDMSEIKKIANTVKMSGCAAEALVPARIVTVRPLGMGDRVCVDTCNLMTPGEGMLIGSQSAGLFLIHSEVDDSPYVASRPFRVNAGAVYSYMKVNDITRYLSELKAGDDLTIVGADGKTRPGIVGRVKIESRPMMLLEAEAEGKVLKVILQNAETVKLVRPDGKSVSVTQIKDGDEVLVKIEEAGRHFGMQVTEKIIEN
ncbi:3-dehydroquinate synthase [Methanimicrococcus sp. At1]|uniref:3-dehydroquinate synthase n=1 Tax=Methanimicrococcus hacksteinii TaxID=3028293 RepID=A0ABU3VMJ1_9EURY|nr:3-dehydroquinate synthase II [Methanimicrococcus sp. At1]MDV0444619.1 3-dehydroquinate synthase [Methanimicrococcus sp. At1]